MKIIYDRKTVEDNRKKEEAELHECERRFNLKLAPIIILTAIIYGVAMYFFSLHCGDDKYAFVILAAGILLGIVLLEWFFMYVFVYDGPYCYLEKASDDYCYIKTIYADYELISEKIEDGKLIMRFKDKNKFVHKHEIRLKTMERKEKADIEEIIVNFNTNEIWIPYQEN